MNFVYKDRRTSTGSNLRKILLDSGAYIIPGQTSPSQLSNFQVYETPLGDDWKLTLLTSLIFIRDQQWEIKFSDEDESLNEDMIDTI